MEEFKNPWKILSEKLVYDNAWITVTEFDIVNPGGGYGIYGKIHFKNIAVGILPLDENLDTYLVGQFRFPLGEYSWEIPEGGGNSKEEPLESAKRELLEETGLAAKEWRELMTMHLSNSVSDEFAVIYLARQLEQLSPKPEETEKLLVRKFSFEEVYQMADKGIITDSISVAAILKLKCMLSDGRIAGLYP